jgi:ribosomal protein S18 acetylase RimI-like enzyme
MIRLEKVQKYLNRNVICRELRLSDIPRLYRMYTHLSGETKKYFHPFPEEIFSFTSLITWMPLTLSSIKPLRKILLRLFPLSVYISFCCLYSNEIIGFIFIKLRNRHCGSLGIVVRDEFQSMGIASKLMNYMIILARREGIRKIHLTVLADNYRAIKFFEKFGFKKTNFIRECDAYGGKKHDCVEMWLGL